MSDTSIQGSPSGTATRSEPGPQRVEPPAPHLVLFDGACGLCHGWVRFVIRRDRRARFRFAALDSGTAASILARHGLRPDFRGSVVLVRNWQGASESLDLRSTAALGILGGLGGAWSLAAGCFGWLPRRLRDGVYDAIAARRLRWFGTADACLLMRPEWRDRFLS